MTGSRRGSALTSVLLSMVLVLIGIWAYRYGAARHAVVPPIAAVPTPLPVVRHHRHLPAPPVRVTPAFTILGSLGARPIVREVLPTYPVWAEEKGISGNVKLNFRVNNEGDVAPNIWVTETIGNPEFDEIAVKALKQWKFAPLKTPERWPELPNVLEDAEHGQPGVIDFNFTLADKSLST